MLSADARGALETANGENVVPAGGDGMRGATGGVFIAGTAWNGDSWTAGRGEVIIAADPGF
jgi:hypothetical protein